LAIRSSDTKLAYGLGRNICTSCSSESLMDSTTVDANLVVIRLAQTIGYNLFITDKLLLPEALEMLAVASSNFCARSILCL